MRAASGTSGLIIQVGLSKDDRDWATAVTGSVKAKSSIVAKRKTDSMMEFPEKRLRVDRYLLW